MKQEIIDNNFNVGNPTKENIEYAFKNLLFYANAAACLNLYIGQRDFFNGY